MHRLDAGIARPSIDRRRNDLTLHRNADLQCLDGTITLSHRGQSVVSGRCNRKLQDATVAELLQR